MWILDDVIAAVASAPGAGRRGIVRASGPNVQSVVGGMLESALHRPPDRRDEALLHPALASRFETALRVDGLSTPLPAALFVWPDHRSYSGHPTIEIHTI
ncbi:MAG TPA: hypothetical protein VM510_13210 [Caulifigura sp.]|nr:hypothetical protein [Caulifigura sp.]